MKELLIFILSSAGLTQILCYGSIFNRIRPKRGILGELFACSMCLGFHVGYINFTIMCANGFYLAPFNFSTLMLFGFLSSYTSYVLDKIIGDYGIKCDFSR